MEHCLAGACVGHARVIVGRRVTYALCGGCRGQAPLQPVNGDTEVTGADGKAAGQRRRLVELLMDDDEDAGGTENAPDRTAAAAATTAAAPASPSAPGQRAKRARSRATAVRG
jgi:hypothetical protein